MIVGDFNVMRVSLVPTKTDTPLSVYADAVLAITIARQGFEVICRGDTQIVERSRTVDDVELVHGPSQDLRRELHTLTIPQLLGLLVPETFNHTIKLRDA